MVKGHLDTALVHVLIYGLADEVLRGKLRGLADGDGITDVCELLGIVLMDKVGSNEIVLEHHKSLVRDYLRSQKFV